MPARRANGWKTSGERALRKTFSELESRNKLLVLVNQRQTLRKTAA
jgi:hypothetical protein